MKLAVMLILILSNYAKAQDPNGVSKIDILNKSDQFALERTDLIAAQPGRAGLMTMKFQTCLLDSAGVALVENVPVTITRMTNDLVMQALTDARGCIHWAADVVVQSSNWIDGYRIRPNSFARGKNIAFDLRTTGTDRNSIVQYIYTQR